MSKQQLRGYHSILPTIGKEVYIDQSAVIIGDVSLGDHASVWCNVTIRGDVHYIRIGERTSVQDNTVLHVTHDTHPTIVGSDVTIGHSVNLHGCTVEDCCLIGIGAIILDGAVIGRESIIAAGTLVPPNCIIPPRSMVMGIPGKPVRKLNEKELAHLKESAENYVAYAKEYLKEKEAE